jgi:hypothetical protein
VTDIEDFYREAGIVLTKMGTRWKADCPFHVETQSSFVVYPDGSYHCFGCGAHGKPSDIQEYFDLDYYVCPDVNDAKDPILDRYYIIKDQLELELLLHLEDCTDKFRCYDKFDKLMIVALDLAYQLETTLISLVRFMRVGFTKVKNSTA